MRARSLRSAALVFFAGYALLAVYPGALLIRGPRPFVFGMPFPLVAASALIIAGFIILILLDRAYRAAEAATQAGDE